MSKKVIRVNKSGRARRRMRVRKKVSGSAERPRLAVFRGNKNMSCEAIDDDLGVTLASASTLEKDFKSAGPVSKTEAAKRLGELVAERLKGKGIDSVVFDRGGYKYHGRVRALAEAAREKGIRF